MSLKLKNENKQDSNKRIQNLTIVKPIIYGNISQRLKEISDKTGHTHVWKIYLKSYENENMEAYVEKVIFKLHESFANPMRTISNPPYEITETGWGEFNVVIRVYFKDPSERPVVLNHFLQINHNIDQLQKSETLSQTCVIYENYDEFVFKNPSIEMKNFLLNIPKMPSDDIQHDTNSKKKHSEVLKNIRVAKTNVKKEIVILRNQLNIARETIKTFGRQVSEAEKNLGFTEI